METLSLPPGPKGLPFVGMAHHFMRDFVSYLATVRSHGDIVAVPFAGKRFIYIFDPDLVEQVLVKRRKHFDKGEMFNRVKVLFGEGLLTAEGEAWRTQRRRMAPAFQPKHFGPFADAIATATARSMDGMGEGGDRFYLGR